MKLFGSIPFFIWKSRLALLSLRNAIWYQLMPATTECTGNCSYNAYAGRTTFFRKFIINPTHLAHFKAMPCMLRKFCKTRPVVNFCLLQTCNDHCL